MNADRRQPRTDQSQSIRAAAQRAAESLRSGALPLRHVLGLNDGEMAAIAEAADAHRRQGRLAAAAAIYSLLLAHDPLRPAYWSALAGLQQRQGNHTLAVACYEAAALLGPRDPEQIGAEDLSLRAIGEAELAAELTAVLSRRS